MTLRRASALAAGLLFFALPSGAQELKADPGAVEACFASTSTGDVAPPCLGKAAGQCQAQPGGDTTLGTSECIRSETEHWDVILNREYQALTQYFRDLDSLGSDASPEELTAALLEAQRAWIAFRDVECGFAYQRWRGGTIRSIVFANCMMVFTAERAIELRDMQGGA